MLFVLNPDRVPVEVCGLDPGCASCGRDPGLCCFTHSGCWLMKEGWLGAIEFGCDSDAVWEGRGTSSELDGSGRRGRILTNSATERRAGMLFGSCGCQRGTLTPGPSPPSSFGAGRGEKELRGRGVGLGVGGRKSGDFRYGGGVFL